MKRLTACAAVLGAAATAAAAGAQDADPLDDNRAAILDSMVGDWAGAITGVNHRSGEAFDIAHAQTCFRPANQALLVCEGGEAPRISHDVYQFWPGTGEFIGAYNGVTKPDLHVYQVSGLDEHDTADAWSVTLETDGEFRGEARTRRVEFSLQDGVWTRRSLSRTAGSEEEFEHDYTIRLERVG